jgi:putative hemin transport protein
MTRDDTLTTLGNELAERWAVLRQTKPGLRNRDAAEELGVSEAELIASRRSDSNFRLRPDWPALFAHLPKLGRVMALTRNEHVVHERHGTYEPASFQNHVGLVLGSDIDLRIFLRAWSSGFAVEEESRRGVLHSLQVFDRHGVAIHKIYAGDQTDMAAWQALTDMLREPDSSLPLEIVALTEKAKPKDLVEIDAAALLDGWANLQDTHEFQGLLTKTGTQPTQAFHLAEGRFTTRLDTGAVRQLLTDAAQQQVPIMVFVGNRGIIQIHTGPVARIEVMGPWLNVLDPDFNLHLREDRIGEVWHVEKPTTDGIVTSVEAFDAAGERIATFFGKRKPGQPELTSWQILAQALPRPSVREPAPGEGAAA